MYQASIESRAIAQGLKCWI